MSQLKGVYRPIVSNDSPFCQVCDAKTGRFRRVLVDNIVFCGACHEQHLEKLQEVMDRIFEVESV